MGVRWKTWAPVALAAAVVAIVLTVTSLVGSGGTRSGRPALLHLAGNAGVALAGAEPAADNGGSGGGPPGASPYVLDGTLPADQPADQPVWRITTADDAAATRVARALGLAGDPTRIDGGWVLRASGGLRLAVREDGSWTYGMDCFAGRPVTEESLDVMCATASGSSTAGPPDASGGDAGDPVDPPQTVPPGPSADKARAAAAPMFDALGLADARVTVTEGSPTTSVQASADVHGTPTVGLSTTLSFTGDGELANGDGWLVDVTRGDSYPVVTAQRAFELLKEQPRPMIEMCLRRPDGKPGCADIPPTVITGATLGLAMAQDAGRPTLVPAWLFTVRGQDEPLAQVAVEPSYLAPPPTPSDLPGSVPPDGGSGSGTSVPPNGGSEPGSPGPPDTKPVVTPVGASPA